MFLDISLLSYYNTLSEIEMVRRWRYINPHFTYSMLQSSLYKPQILSSSPTNTDCYGSGEDNNMSDK